MADQTITEGTVSYDSIIDQPIASVWLAFSDFAGWGQWCDSFAYMKPVEGKEGDKPTREYKMSASSMTYQDELLSLEESDHSLKYNLLSITPAMPALVSVVTTIKLDVLSENQTKITWSSVSKTVGLSQEMLERINGMRMRAYDKHIGSLSSHLAQPMGGL